MTDHPHVLNPSAIGDPNQTRKRLARAAAFPFLVLAACIVCPVAAANAAAATVWMVGEKIKKWRRK